MRYLWAIAAALILVYGNGYIYNKDRHMGLRNTSHRLEIAKAQMNEIGRQLKIYKKSHGHYPSTEEGLSIIPELVRKRPDEPNQDRYPIREIRVTPSGVLSPWGEPYIYENRNGKPASVFAESGTDKDIRRKYSVRVDHGVYIWSTAGKQQYQELAHWLPIINWAHVFMLALAIACLVCYFVACRRRIDPADPHKIGSYGLSTIGGLATTFITWAILFPTTVSTCYAQIIQKMRTPEITDNYITIMRKYRDNGVISNQAYDKLLKALKEDEKSSEY